MTRTGIKKTQRTCRPNHRVHASSFVNNGLRIGLGLDVLDAPDQHGQPASVARPSRGLDVGLLLLVADHARDGPAEIAEQRRQVQRDLAVAAEEEHVARGRHGVQTSAE